MLLELLVSATLIKTPPRVEFRVGESNYSIEHPIRRVRTGTSYGSPGFASSSSAVIIGDSDEQCVEYAKRMSGISKSLGYAGNTIPEGTTPKVGSIALERSYGHAMYVTEVTSEGIKVTESNFIRGKITARFIPYSDIKGYVYRV